MNREAGNGSPEKVGIGWRERDRKEIEEGETGIFFFIRRESRGGQTTAKKKRRNRERGGSREKEVTEGEEEVENLDTEVSLEGKFFFQVRVLDYIFIVVDFTSIMVIVI